MLTVPGLAVTLAIALLQDPSTRVEVPLPVVAGLEALEAGRCDEAFTRWSRPPRPGEGTKAVQRLTDCASLRRLGPLHGHEVLRVVGVGSRIRRVYLMLRYDTQPVYVLLVAYQPQDEWHVIRVSWNTDADRILPAVMVPPERRAVTRP